MNATARNLAGAVGLALIGLLAGAVTDSVAAGLAVVAAATLGGCAARQREVDRVAARLRLCESAVTHARDAVVVLAADARPGHGRKVLFANPAFLAMTGYAGDEILGRSLHRLAGPRTSRRSLDALRRALDAGVEHQTELLNYRKDGRELWVELSVVPVRDRGRLLHWVMIQRDVTDRKRADARLRAREEQLRVLGDNLPGGAVYRAEQRPAGGRTYRYISAGVEALTGLTAGELRGDGHALCRRVHPDDAARVEAAEAESARTLAPLDCEFRVQHTAGDWRTLHARAMPAALPGGGVRWDGVLFDTTARHRLEDQLRHAQKMETVGRLAGGVAHDFNNILTGVIASLALVDCPAGDPNAGHVRVAALAAARAADVTKKLLGFARKSPLRAAPVLVGDLFAEAVGLARPALDPRVSVTVEPPTAPLPPLVADATLLNQALLNLLLNARDALPDGGRVTLSAALEELSALDCHGRADRRTGRFVRLRVADTGVGMGADTKARLFEPFFTTKPVGQGTGLGLAMVHGIAQQHGGWVECDSSPGRGARFDVYLPCPAGDVFTPPPPRPRPGLDQTPAPAEFGRGRTVLFADDEATIRHIGVSVLEAAGFAVVEAADGSEAVERFAELNGAPGGVAVVVLDLMMPGLNGREAFGEITRLDPGARVLFSSGYAEEELADVSARAGLLPKPYRPADLLAAVRAVLAGQRVTAPLSDPMLLV